jgi:HEAT repeat protein
MLPRMLTLFFMVWAAKALAAPLPAKLPLDETEKVRRLEAAFQREVSSPQEARKLRVMALSLKQKAVPTLIKVMKDATYPEKNRWQATMVLGRVMGKKSAPFIARFADHPAWMMRVASLKALSALGMSEYQVLHAKALKDPSLIVRVQALDNISTLQMKPLAPHVWGMLYDQSNYTGPSGQRRRTSIVRSVIRTLGDLRYEKARPALAKLIQRPRYKDLVEDLDYSLEKITGKTSPDTTEDARRQFWARL